MEFKLQQKTKQLPSHSNLSKFLPLLLYFTCLSMYKRIGDKTSQNLKSKALEHSKRCKKTTKEAYLPTNPKPHPCFEM